MIDWTTVLMVAFFSLLSLFIGSLSGFFCGYSRAENYYESIKQAKKQQQMWEDYINALKGASHEKE
jgi:hypothetical protein